MNQNDVKEALDALKNIVEYWTYKPSEVKAAKLAISALEKQLPKEALKKPIFEGVQAEKLKNKGFKNYETYKCPECNHIVSNRGFTGITVQKFCNNCGQRLKEAD